MIDEHQVREMLQRRANAVPTIVVDAPKAARRARRRLLANGAVAVLAAAAIAVATIAGVDAIRSAPVPADRPTPSPAPGVLRASSEVLSFTGVPFEAPGDLVAVNPSTGEERVLVEDLDLVYSARWSADGRWVAYETPEPDGDWGLWVVGASQEPRLVTTGGDPDMLTGQGLYWSWSRTGAELAIISRSTLSTIDLATGETTDLGSIVADLLEPNCCASMEWSPDGTRIAFGAAGGGLYTVDVRSGERSLLVRLPREALPTIWEVLWSPDGAHIAVVNQLEPDGWRMYVMSADGSNVRVLVDDFERAGVAWSPDGTRLAYAGWSEPDRKVRIWVAPMDGLAPAEIGSLDASCHYFYKCDLTWSPDGSQIAFTTETSVPEAGQGDQVFSTIDADGRGEAERIEQLAYRSWDGGSYSCECT